VDQCLRPLQDYRFDLTFFGTREDLSEIAAIRQVWPNVLEIEFLLGLVGLRSAEVFAGFVWDLGLQERHAGYPGK
jgi:hypothetical protein